MESLTAVQHELCGVVHDSCVARLLEVDDFRRQLLAINVDPQLFTIRLIASSSSATDSLVSSKVSCMSLPLHWQRLP